MKVIFQEGKQVKVGFSAAIVIILVSVFAPTAGALEMRIAGASSLPSGGLVDIQVTRNIKHPKTKLEPMPLTGVKSQPPLVITLFELGENGLEYIEIYNQHSAPINLRDVTLTFNNNLESSVKLAVDDQWILPGNFGLWEKSNLLPKYDQRITSLQLNHSEITLQTITDIPAIMTTVKHLDRNYSTIGKTYSLWQDGIFANSYHAPSNSYELIISPSDFVSETPQSANGLEIIEFSVNSKTCAPATELAECRDYIKVKNISDKQIDLMQYRIITSSSGANSVLNWHQLVGSPNLESEYILKPQETFIIKQNNAGEDLNLSAGGGYIALQDFYGTQSFISLNYDDMSSTSWKSVAVAYDEIRSGWFKSIASFSANVEFIQIMPKIPAVSQRKPCRENQYRSEETGRCRNIASSANTRKPCKEGQYRSEETGRCRSIAAAAAKVLKPCKDDQFRNPATGRCRKIASTEDLIKPCKPGYQRNPITNRCRKIKKTGVPQAAYAVEPVKNSTSSLAGWTMFGSLLALAISYGIWEWRLEISQIPQKVRGIFPNRHK